MKDRKISREGRVLVEFLEERGWCIFNGVIKENEEGEFTYTKDRGNDRLCGRGREGEGEDKKDGSRREDHHPIIVTVEERRSRRRKNGEEKERVEGLRKEGEDLEEK